MELEVQSAAAHADPMTQQDTSSPTLTDGGLVVLCGLLTHVEPERIQTGGGRRRRRRGGR